MTKRPNACFVSLSFAGLVVLARSLNPIPSRTRPLNSSAPMVLWLKPWESRSLPGLPRTKHFLFTCHDQNKRRLLREAAFLFGLKLAMLMSCIELNVVDLRDCPRRSRRCRISIHRGRGKSSGHVIAPSIDRAALLPYPRLRHDVACTLHPSAKLSGRKS